jgi:hypothetical protein
MPFASGSLDNCISPRFGKALRILAEVQAYQIVHLSEKFDRSISDIEWLSNLSSESDWVIVSGDPRITRSRSERAAWQETGFTAFFFGDGWASRGYWNQAVDIVRWWPQIVLEARRVRVGTGYLIPVKGKEMKLIYTPP